MSSSKVHTGTMEMIFAMVLAGTIGVFVIESEQSAYNVVFYRCLFGAIGLSLYCIWRGLLNFNNFDTKATFLTVFGGVCIVFNWVFLFKSYSLTSISLATVIYHTQPFYVVLLGMIVFGEGVTVHKIGWIIAAFIGLVSVTNISFSSLETDGDYIRGVGYALLAAVLFTGNTISTKALKGISPCMIALIHVTLGIVLLLPFATLAEVEVVGSHWVFLVSLGLVHTCVLYVLMYSAYDKLPTSMIAVLSFIYPAVAILIDFIIYNRVLSIVQWIGIFLIFVSGFAVKQGWSIWPTQWTRSIRNNK